MQQNCAPMRDGHTGWHTRSHVTARQAAGLRFLLHQGLSRHRVAQADCSTMPPPPYAVFGLLTVYLQSDDWWV
jgi:hypothetical protein